MDFFLWKGTSVNFAIVFELSEGATFLGLFLGHFLILIFESESNMFSIAILAFRILSDDWLLQPKDRGLNLFWSDVLRCLSEKFILNSSQDFHFPLFQSLYLLIGDTTNNFLYLVDEGIEVNEVDFIVDPVSFTLMQGLDDSINVFSCTFTAIL